ncbi:MAG: hypothetical protein Q8861_10210 [Bacteroidota bacterium]|nr:hypothetical protein [Bacteroidota bacterium]
MRTILIITTLFIYLTTYGQKESTYITGKLYTIDGLTYDKLNKDTVRLVTIELFSNGKQLIATRTDLNGRFRWTVCSNKLLNNSLAIKTTAAGYYQKTYDFKLRSDTLIVLTLVPDPKKEITLKKQSEYEYNLFHECGAKELETEYKENAFYRHCDGRILTFKQLMNRKENLNEWNKIINDK